LEILERLEKYQAELGLAKLREGFNDELGGAGEPDEHKG